MFCIQTASSSRRHVDKLVPFELPEGTRSLKASFGSEQDYLGREGASNWAHRHSAEPGTGSTLYLLPCHLQKPQHPSK